MNGPRVFLTLLLAFLLLPLSTGSHSEADADAGDTRGSASGITEGRHRGHVGGQDDPADWFAFSVNSLDTIDGRATFHIEVRADGGWNPGLELYTGTEESNPSPTLSGEGAFGIKIIRAAATTTGTHAFRITGNGYYELNFTRKYENDFDTNRDALDATSSGNAMDLGTLGPNGLLVEGNMSRRDPGDAYKFLVSGTSGRILVTLDHAPTTNFNVELRNPGSVTPSLVVREDGRRDNTYETAYSHGGGSGTWVVRVTNPDREKGYYRLMIRHNPNENQDEGVDDASDILDAAPAVGQGIRFGQLTALTDTQDAFKLTGVSAGQILHVGLTSYKLDATRPAVKGILYDPTQQHELGSIVACQNADAINTTARVSGTYYLRVYLNPSECTAPGSNGNYAFSFRAENQQEGPLNDAPNNHNVAPSPPHNTTRLGWMGHDDDHDIYRVGVLSKGDVVRGSFQALTDGMEASISVLGPTGQTLYTSRTSNGVARLEGVAIADGNHYVKFQRFVNEDDDIFHSQGFYRFAFVNVTNQPPTAVFLEDPQNTPLDDDVGRNHVRLQWTRNQDSDFQKYEIHVGTTATFTPSPSTLRAVITQQSQTQHSVTGLEAGRTYTFLVRTWDDTNLTSDSNRRTETTDGSAVGNIPPTLSGGSVSPPEGNPSTVFTFRVTYDDDNNDPPQRKRVYIDGTPREMTSSDTTYNDGAEFSFATTLPAGTHSYYFDFSDGTADARDPPANAYNGPTVVGTGNQPPTVDAKATPSSGSPPLRVTFNATANDPENGALTYEWDFDNSDGFQVQATGREVVHTYNSPGTYTATVRVRDPAGALATDSVTVVVSSERNDPPNTAPTATPSEGLAPLTVKFDAKANDPDGAVVSYEWDFDNSDGLQKQATTAQPTHTYDKAGSFVATVIVRDNKGATSTGSVTVLVRTTGNSPPSLQIDADPEEGAAPLVVNFTANAFDPDGGPVTVSWDFNVANGISSEATGTSVNHTFTASGTYTVLATARDEAGATATSTLNVIVRSGGAQTNNSLVTIVASPASGRVPLTVQFRIDSTDPGLTFVRYQWDFGDGSPIETSAAPNHTFDSPGTYDVRVQAFDGSGNVYIADKEIVVEQRAGGGGPGFEAIVVLAAIAATVFLVGRRRRADRF